MFRDVETLKIWRDKAKQLQYFENSSKLKSCEYPSILYNHIIYIKYFTLT